jgi:para-nitrobenzyl esterase
MLVRRETWRGCVQEGIECYYGIRYARLAQPDHPRGNVVATAAEQCEAAELTGVPVFPQLPSRLELVTGPGGRVNPQSDEAFFLNVWAPQASERLPVLVFIHGGAWASGGGAMRWYRGQRLAAEGLVVVTLNYRLGPAGHLDNDSAATEAGIHRPFDDLLLALRWVREHIGELGGDPDRVTLAGQSAGAWYAWALASLPAAKGLLRQAALLSIPRIVPWTPDYRADFTRRALALAVPAGGETLRQALLRAGAQVLSDSPRVAGAMPPMYLPVLTAEQAERLADADSATPHCHAEAFYVRVTRHEMSAFLPPGPAALLPALRQRAGAEQAPRQAPPAYWLADYAEAVALSSWLEFGRFAGEIADATARHGRAVVRRHFAALASTPHLGAVHCMDLPFQFGNFADWADAPILADWTPETFELLSAAVRADLAGFVHGRHDRLPLTLGEAP